MVIPEKKAETMRDKKCGMMPEKYPSYFSMVMTTMMHRFFLEMVIVIYSWAIAIEGVLSKVINGLTNLLHLSLPMTFLCLLFVRCKAFSAVDVVWY